ncbi:Outer membrane protein beta-barrel domain-containing protein [Lutibacter oricola]|uniref:Outer membrane protein beta-barrel domain-containing protein n=1 Tax=Lutibacter oricola TaxID=762486 RepID=A0A1H3G630_9FLAO|nr:outer membrane beta-barrel protein [Lutibacter oricola]SDX98510.1 Outer membrane protein beta-barrel domain-containing protein [Lutibacter oricola]
MKNQLLLAIALIVTTSISAQFYVSASGGYAIPSAGVLMGQELNADRTEAKNHYGSFGEGLNTQLKGGYFFNDTFGVELAFAYLHGSDQVRDSYLMEEGVITEVTDAKAYGRAFGLSASLVYNFNEKVYGRFGAITKLGGRTGAELTRENATPFGPIVTEGKLDFHGRPPLGFIAALGHKFKLNDNFHLFAELEYLGINVTRDNSEFTELTINAPAVPANALGAGHPGIPAATWNLGDAPLNHPVYGTLYAPTKTTYEDELSTSNTDPSKTLSETVPYSSFGINFGITYTFGKKGE